MPVFRIGSRQYRTKGEAEKAVQAVLHGHPVGTVLCGEDFDLVRDLLDMHHEASDKVGAGVADIRIAPPLIGRFPGFEVVRLDGSTIDFSYRTCLKAPSLDSQVRNVLRMEVDDLTTAYLEHRVSTGTLVSDESGVPLITENLHVSYFRGPSFNDISRTFAENEGGLGNIRMTPSTAQGLGELVDREQAERWREHWKERARLGLLTPEENRQRPRSR
ncbi:DCL family protein [Kitasatospora purpeofusca]|uniref:DCL family protein n=1 Tax=Kitasatospora purpeofusca TaxID=67352 RepID=UPI0035D62A18